MTRVERQKLLGRLRRDGRVLADAFSLGQSSYEIHAARSNAHHYGICDQKGVIRIRLVSRATGKPLRYSSMINTLCHELAHLRHFNHGPGFKAFYFEVLRWAKERGMYRPRRPERKKAPIPRAGQTGPEQSGPAQLGLFG